MRMEFRAFHGPADWGWALQFLKLNRVDDTCGITAVDLDENKTVGMCILDNWTHSSVQAHIIITTSFVLRHGFLEKIAEYVYDRAGRYVIISLVPADDLKAIRFDKRIGFEEVARIRDGYKLGVDTVIFEMRKDTCQWLRGSPNRWFRKPLPAVVNQ